MKRISPFVLPMLAAFLLLAAPVAASADLEKGFWRTWNPGLREAAASDRFILVDIYTDWCGWCKRMDRDVYGRSDVREYLSRRFVTIKLNAESSTPGSYEGKSLTSRSIASRFRVNGYPTTIFLRPGGEHLVNVPGYVEGDKFLLLLRYIGDGHMDRGVSFEEFSKRSAGGPAGRK